MSNHLNLLKEVGYILLFVTFFVGVIVGSLGLKNVDNDSFDAYAESLEEHIAEMRDKNTEKSAFPTFFQGLKAILFYWIVGLSVIGTPILIAHLGYKGYSLGYTLTAVLKLLGLGAGNQFIFQKFFFQNLFLIFILIYLANYSIKNSKNFFENKANVKENALKYTALTLFAVLLWGATCFAQKLFF